MRQKMTSFMLQNFRQYQTLWHKRHYGGLRFSETVEVFPQRSYGAHEQQTIDIFRPRCSTHLPIVVMVPGSYFCSLDHISLQAEIKAYTHAGYAVALVSYRVAPEHAYPVQLKDLSLALRWLQQHQDIFLIEPLFFLHGFQSGANLLLNYCNGLEQHYLQEAFKLNTSVTLKHIRACILSDGIYDLEQRPFSTQGIKGKLNQLFLGPQDSHALAGIASPAQHLARSLPKLLLTATPEGPFVTQYLHLKHQLESAPNQHTQGQPPKTSQPDLGSSSLQTKLTTQTVDYVTYFDFFRYENKICAFDQYQHKGRAL